MLRLRAVRLLLVICMSSSSCGFLVPDLAGAEMHVQPRLLVEQEYTDNFFRGETNEAEFWVTQISPGFYTAASTDRSRLDLDYAFRYFLHNSEEEDLAPSQQDYSGHNLSLYAAHRFFTKLSVGVSEEYFLTREPASSDRFSQSVERSKYWRNRVSPYIGYDIAEKGAIKLGYRNEELGFTERRAGQEDSTEHRGSVTLTYHLNSTNDLDLEAQLWTREYEGTLSRYDSYQGKLNFRHEFNTYLKGEMGAGYQKRDFEKATLDDLEEVAFHADLNGTTDITKLRVRVERNIPDFTEGDAYFIAYRGDLFFERILLEAIRTYLGGSYQYSDYLQSEREDSTYSGYVGLGYRFFNKIFELSLEYKRTERDSNQTGLSYEENQVFLRLNIAYDFAAKE